MLQGISAAPRATVAMLMDPRAETLADLAEIYAAPTTTEVGRVLASPEVDAVYVSLPRGRGAQVAIEAARAGKHVLIEAPMATGLQEADALISACGRYGVGLGVTYAAQVDAALSAARDLVRAGMLGQVLAVRMEGGGESGDSDVALARVTQQINTVRWVTGLEVVRVYAEAGHATALAGTNDTLGAVLRYDNDAIGVLLSGAALSAADDGVVSGAVGPRIYGTRGQLFLAATPLVRLDAPPEGGVPGAWQELRYSGPAGDPARVVQRFAEAVLDDRRPPASGDDGRRALEVAVACRHSADLRQPVELPLAG